MLFNSAEFLVFFALVYASYLALRSNHRLQNILLLLASYVFYGWWDWRFLGLIWVSTLVDYAAGRAIEAATTERARRLALLTSIVSNLGILGFFKYFDFFAESTSEALAVFGIDCSVWTLNILLPVGISFYTFQTLSYTVDVYRRRMSACRRLDDFALFVAFFPQLVAGPIERAPHLIGQIERPRHLNASDINAGIWLVVWGLFKKMVIADRLSPIANDVFDVSKAHSGLDLILGALAFTFQIYADFSGYSDIARGLAKLLGFDLMTNFRLPYLV